MGTGPAGVLAIYAKTALRFGDVCGADHVAAFLPLARAAATRCGALVDFRESSLFSAVSGRYDLICFNSPYVPDTLGRRLGAFKNELERQRWSGGQDGLGTVRPFLSEAPAHLTRTGLLLLGVNHFYVEPEALGRVVADAGLEEVATIRNRLTLACVHVLRSSDDAIRSGP